MNPNGSGQVNLTNNGTGEASGQPSWQPILESYVRPKGATPLLASLVPAFKPCGVAERHPRLAARVRLVQPAAAGIIVPHGRDARCERAGGECDRIGADEDVQLSGVRRSGTQCRRPLDVSITDVRKKADLSDYTGQLRVDAALRLTDREQRARTRAAPGRAPCPTRTSRSRSPARPPRTRRSARPARPRRAPTRSCLARCSRDSARSGSSARSRSTTAATERRRRCLRRDPLHGPGDLRPLTVTARTGYHHFFGAISVSMWTCLVSWKASRPSWPSSRPSPDCLKPPNGPASLSVSGSLNHARSRSG